MARRLPILKPKDIVRALEKAGFVVHHHTGSHARLIHTTRPELRVTIPIHNKDIQPSLLKLILKQAQLTDDEFLRLL